MTNLITKLKNRVKAGFYVDSHTSMDQFFRRSTTEHQLIEFCYQISHKQKFLAIKVPYPAICGGQTGHVVWFPGSGSK